jgi:hypothetical protein
MNLVIYTEQRKVPLKIYGFFQAASVYCVIFTFLNLVGSSIPVTKISRFSELNGDVLLQYLLSEKFVCLYTFLNS